MSYDKRRKATIGDDGLFDRVVQGYTGSHTIADCDNLIANYKKWIDELGTQYQGLMGAWKAKDPTASKQWGLDYNGLQTRFARAIASVEESRSHILPDSVTGAEEVYQGLVHAVRQGGEGATLQAGDFEDLRNRLQAYATSVSSTLKFTSPEQPAPTPTDPGWTTPNVKIPGFQPMPGLPKIPWNEVALVGGAVLASLLAIEVVPPILAARAIKRTVQPPTVRYGRR